MDPGSVMLRRALAKDALAPFKRTSWVFLIGVLAFINPAAALVVPAMFFAASDGPPCGAA
jgi:hypothetical protein